MATLTVKAQILQQATLLQQKFAQAKTQMDQLNPTEQIGQMASLSQDTEALTALQKKVQASFMRQQDAIPNITEDELLAISEKLSGAHDNLEMIQTNNEIAEGIFILATAELTNVDPMTVQSLQERATVLSSCPHINAGNLEAIQQLQLSFSHLLQTQTPTAPNRSSPPRAQNHGTSPTLTPVQVDRNLREEQDEDFQATSLRDKLNDLERKFQAQGYVPNPVTDFEAVLAVYKETKAYSQSKPLFASTTASLSLQQTLQKAEQSLMLIITSQARIESAQVQQVQVQQSDTAALQRLKTALEKMSAEIQKAQPELTPCLVELTSAFPLVSSDDKAKLMTALFDILKAANKYPKDRDPPKSMLGLGIAQWMGTNDQKIEAVKKVLSQVAPTPSTPQVAVPKHADEMNRRLQEAKSAGPSQQAQRSPTTPPQTSPVRPQVFTSPDDFDVQQLHFGQDDIPHFPEPALTVGIKELQMLLPLLEAHASFSDLQAALELLVFMESKGDKCAFKMSSQTAALISERPCFHLWLLHNKPSGDPQYGNNAMAGVHPTTNPDRQRAIQRTIVEVALENLDEAVNFGDVATMAGMLNLLEEMKLDAADYPEGCQNIAHSLFGLMYNLHVDARRTNGSLINPNDGKFKGDFGRNAFRMTEDGIDPAVKLKAVSTMLAQLKTAWKV